MQPVEEREKDEKLTGMEFLFDNYKPEFWYFKIVVTVLRLLLTGILGLIEPGSSTQLTVGMLISFAAIMMMMGLRPYESNHGNNLSVLSFIQIFLVMLCGLVLKSQDLASSKSFDKENLSYVLITVNVLVVVMAIILAVLEFNRKGHADYSSSNVIALAKRGMDSQLSRGESEAGRGSSLFDVFSGFKRKVLGGKNKKMLASEIELGDIYGEKGDIFDGVNPVQRAAAQPAKKVGYAVNVKHEALTFHRQYTNEEAEAMEPPPMPTVFTSPDVNDNL